MVLKGRSSRAGAGPVPTRAHGQLLRGPPGPYLLRALEADLADGLVVLVLVPGALVATAAAAAAAATHRARLGLVAGAPPLALPARAGLRLRGDALPRRRRRRLRDRRLRKAPRTFPGVASRRHLLAGGRQGRRRRRQLVRAPAPRDHLRRWLVWSRGALGGRGRRGQRWQVAWGHGDRGRLSRRRRRRRRGRRRGRLGVPTLRPAAQTAAEAALKAHGGAAAALLPAQLAGRARAVAEGRTEGAGGQSEECREGGG